VVERIRITYEGTAELQKAVSVQMDYIQSETLALEIQHGLTSNSDARSVEINDNEAKISVRPVN